MNKIVLTGLTVTLVVFLCAAPGCAGPVRTSSAGPTTTPHTTNPPPTSSQPASGYTVGLATKPGLGSYLVDGQGMTLYYTVSDRPDYSNLPDELLTSWPAFHVTAIVIPSTLSEADFSTYIRDNGVAQTTFRGYPLYHFYQDQNPGDTLGNGLNGVWFVASPDNVP